MDNNKIEVYGNIVVVCPNCHNSFPISATELLKGQEIACPCCSYVDHNGDKIIYQQKESNGIWTDKRTTYIATDVDHSQDKYFSYKFTITTDNINDRTKY